MNDLERFLAVAGFGKPDYVPIFAFPGAPGMSRGCMRGAHERLVEGGMPERVEFGDVDAWKRYWGTTDPVALDFKLGRGEKGFESESRIEGEFEIIESENGAVTRQVIDNDQTYSMPQFIRYPVRDRKSWEFYREHVTPAEAMPPGEMEEHCRKYDDRDRPLVVSGIGTYGNVRSLMGMEAASYALFDDPGLVGEMLGWMIENFRMFSVPLIERLRPEIIGCWEDICYKGGMLLSPRHFREFCAPLYREVVSVARDCGVPVVAVDCDGKLAELLVVLEECGVNAVYPFEVRAGNDLFAAREKHPTMILLGGLEKEAINEGNGHMIEDEIRSKVPALLEKGGYFPNGDHGIQPFATYEGLMRFMTILHEVCGNPEGEFFRR